jgi:hypothetical protein
MRRLSPRSHKIMAAFLYDLARDNILSQAGIANATWAGLTTGSILSGTLVCATNSGTGAGVFGSTAYQAVQATDQFFNIIPGFATTGTGSVLAGGFNTIQALPATKTHLAGALFVSGNQLVFSAVATSTLSAGALVLWITTGTASTSPLVAYIDFNNWNPANVIVPNGSSITFTFASSGNGIFKL